MANEAYFCIRKWQEIFSLLFAISTIVLTSDCKTPMDVQWNWDKKRTYISQVIIDNMRSLNKKMEDSQSHRDPWGVQIWWSSITQAWLEANIFDSKVAFVGFPIICTYWSKKTLGQHVWGHVLQIPECFQHHLDSKTPS